MKNIKLIFYYFILFFSVQFFILLIGNWIFFDLSSTYFNFVKKDTDSQTENIILQIKKNLSNIKTREYQRIINKKIKDINQLNKDQLKILSVLVFSSQNLVYNSKLEKAFYISSIQQRRIVNSSKKLIYDDLSAPLPYEELKKLSKGRLWNYMSYFFPEIKQNSVFRSIKVSYQKKRYSIHIIYKRTNLIPILKKGIQDYKYINIIIFGLGVFFSTFIYLITLFLFSYKKNVDKPKKLENQKRIFEKIETPKTNKVLDGIYLG